MALCESEISVAFVIADADSEPEFERDFVGDEETVSVAVSAVDDAELTMEVCAIAVDSGKLSTGLD